MRRIIKWIGIALVIAIVVLQFVRPARNVAGAEAPDDFITRFHPPREVEDLLRVSCFDCHSNETRYPWYAEVQPIGWWLARHIEQGKTEVNFTEFGSYRIRRQYAKLGEMAKQVEEGEMPLPSYLLIHTDAKLSPGRKERFLSWIRTTRDSMKAVTPPDSLERRR